MPLPSIPTGLLRRATASRLVMNGAAGILILIGILLFAWVFSPELIGSLPVVAGPFEAVGAALIGPLPTSLGTLLVYEAAAGYGFVAFLICLGRLRTEGRAIGEAGRRLAQLAEQAQIVEDDIRRGFFSGGALAMAAVERTAAYAMLDNIREDARGFRYEPIALIVDRVAPVLAGSSQSVRDAQTFGLRLGILGTFVGMSLALVDVTQIFSATADVGTAQTAIHAIVGKLSVAFGTSIAGLVAAILLQFIFGGLTAREDRTLDDLQHLAAIAQQVCRRCEMRSSIAREMRDLKDTVTEHRRDIESQAFRVGREVDRLADFANTAAVAFAAPLDSLERSGQALAALIDGQRQAASTLADGIRTTAEAESRLGTAFEQAIVRAGEAQAAALSGLSERIAAQMASLSADIAAGFRTDDRFGSATRVEAAIAATLERLEQLSARQERLIRLFGRIAAALIALAAVAALFLLFRFLRSAGLGEPGGWA